MIKDEIYKIQKEIIIDELKIDLANDVLSIEKKVEIDIFIHIVKKMIKYIIKA